MVILTHCRHIDTLLDRHTVVLVKCHIVTVTTCTLLLCLFVTLAHWYSGDNKLVMAQCQTVKFTLSHTETATRVLYQTATLVIV